MKRRLVRVSGAAQTVEGPGAIDYALWLQTRDMDSIVSIEMLPITGDDRKFIVTGTPR